MFSSVVRAARPASSVARSALKTNSVRGATRAISSTAARRSDIEPSIFGPGAKPGAIPTDFEQSTGLERLELLGKLEGVEVFDYEPLDSSRVGTLADPIKVFSLDHERIIGCTGSPADSHDVHWLTLKQEKNRRCPECGSVYALDFHGEAHGHEHH